MSQVPIYRRADDLGRDTEGSSLRLLGFLRLFWTAARNGSTFEDSFREAHDLWLIIHAPKTGG